MESEQHPGGEQAGTPPGFDAELALLLGPQPAQDTLRALFEHAQGLIYAEIPEDEVGRLESRTLSGSRNPRWGSVLQLGVQVHEFSPADPVTNLRHVATITSSEVLGSSMVERTRELWWSPNGDFFEFRGDDCSEAAAQGLIQGMWPDIENPAA